MKILLSLLVSLLTFLLLQDPSLKESINRGQKIYEQICFNCHKPDGNGLPYSYPPLAGSDFLFNKTEEAIRVVKFGYEGEMVVNGIIYENMMPDHGLSDQQVADVMNYILRSWGNKSELMVTAAMVEQLDKE